MVTDKHGTSITIVAIQNRQITVQGIFKSTENLQYYYQEPPTKRSESENNLNVYKFEHQVPNREYSCFIGAITSYTSLNTEEKVVICDWRNS